MTKADNLRFSIVSTFPLQSGPHRCAFPHGKTAPRLSYNSMAAIQFVRPWPRVNPRALGADLPRKC